MRTNKILEKLLAIILIFTLTSANFMFVTKAYATSLVETLFGGGTSTGHDNVSFDAYFAAGETAESLVVSDVNNEELAISMKIDVQESGYLKDAKVEILEAEEGNGLNFEVKAFEELPDYVQGFENNCIEFQQINSSPESVALLLPIEYKNERFVNEENLSKDCIVRFTGIYVDDDGEENEVSRDVELKVDWKDSREVKVETVATKYIDYGRGVILQTLVKVDNTTENKNLPVKETEIVVSAPALNDVYPSKATVVANTTEGTNGLIAGEVKFDENNWSFNQEENKLTIKVANEKKLVEVNEFEDEYLKEEDREIVEEERYFSVPGVDEYLVTYTYEGATISEGSLTVDINVEAKMITLSGEENDNVVTNKNDYEYLLEGKTGDIVSLKINNETEEVSKAYAYSNYNVDGKYEVEFNSETILNISYKDIVEGINIQDIENKYVGKDGTVTPTNDVYYKQISISKDNFVEIFGEEGQIKVLDEQGTEVALINNESEVNEDGNIVVEFDKLTKLNYEISKPVKEGNFVITNVRAMRNSSLDKATLSNVGAIATKSIVRANYTYVDGIVDVETSEISTVLNDTITNATLELDRDSLSTLATNDDVEIRVALNNATDKSDMYGHSIYEIELPENVESVQVTNSSILYGEGLNITSTEVLDRVIRVTVDGKQEGINSGVLTNGTNLVLNANIKVDLYTPAKSDVIKLRYINDDATNYNNEGKGEVTINYSAPTGLVAVNSTTNYNNNGSVLTSVRQGVKEDLLAIYTDAKVATMELVVMNNNENSISDVAILGRIPFKGNKNIATGEELGTTLDTKLMGALVADVRNTAEFKVYYSANGEATKDLTDTNNGWVENPETFDGMKSYLIVPVDENYEMKETEILRFAYQYEIPANLTHNEDLYGTFITYFTNNTEVASTEETAVPDLIGLTTGEGPELEIRAEANRTTVKEFEELHVKVEVKNTGLNKAEDVNIEFPVPAYTILKEVKIDNKYSYIEENAIIKVSASELEVNEVIEFEVVLEADEKPVVPHRNPGDVVSGTNQDEVAILTFATVTAKDLATTLKSEVSKIEYEEAAFEIKLSNRSDLDEGILSEELDVQKAGDVIEYDINLTNILDKDAKNVVVEQVLPVELDFVNGFSLAYEADGITSKPGINADYDEATRTIRWELGDIKAYRGVQLQFNVKVAELDESITRKVILLTTTVKADGTATYESNSEDVAVGRPVLTASQTTSNTDTYIKEGDAIRYTFVIKNEGGAIARNVKVTDVIPDGVAVKKIEYIVSGIVGNKKVSSSREATIIADIEVNTELIINIDAVASNLGGALEKTVTNYATVSASDVPEIITNSITHIVEASEKNIVASELQESTPSSVIESSGNTNIQKSYRIEGTAWEDTNKNGMRESGETLLSGITARLVDSATGSIKKTVTTDSNGNYMFAGVYNGSYLVMFDYNTVKYTATAYKKEGVGTHVNSDVLTTKVEQSGRSRYAAVSDVIVVNSGSISGIDIGLVLADTFDLKLQKSITKVTMQSAAGIVTDKYENTGLAKTEVAAKHLVGATAYVEYEITVSNVGDVKGYAKKIVDYMPQGMTFNSALEANGNWYTGTDGNLYSTAMADIELAPGESQTIKLVLTKQMTEENTGIVNNLAEIADDYNIYGISDKNSVPFNKAQGENDLGLADTIISVKTGESLVYVSVIITTILLGSIVIFIAYNKLIVSKKRGGV